MIDDFQDSTHYPTDEEILETAREMAERAAMLSFSVVGLATCLLSMIPEHEHQPEDIIALVPNHIYREALRLAPILLRADETEDEEVSAMEIKNFSPERAWPLVLCNAFYTTMGLQPDGRIIGAEHPIFYCRDDFPDRDRIRQIQCADIFEDTFGDFIERGTEKVRQYVGYPHEINPVWLFFLIETAQKREVRLSDDLKTWFGPCFDDVLQMISQADASLPDQSYVKTYH